MRQPFARPNTTLQQQNLDHGDVKKDGEISMRLVNVPTIDKQLSDIADAFNGQREHHLTMEESIRQLKAAYGCASTCSLVGCIEAIKEEHGDWDVKVCMEGYNFSLWIKEEKEDEVPDKLEQAREQVKKMSRATKLIIATETKLQEMMYSVLQNKSQMSERVKQANPEYLDQVRLEGNLEDNFQKLNQVKKLSRLYEEEAKCVLKEVAELAGVSL
ncbi:uncharacterized protein LOC115090335 isoform X2 [Rhinatrema bivittatum]|uniref:uncharacterized protein LOC115090335 isoform X2 n=1 Tax=Rhinatrema bivittatum TaxID=194408 RepID=UPI00112C1D46|nr:uncharacterized protein LOC115090335 isoform X2 [Rhinatrema bivittatum]